MNDAPLLLSGNEAIAAGLAEAGVAWVTGYPGTPSTEIIESLRSKNFRAKLSSKIAAFAPALSSPGTPDKKPSSSSSPQAQTQIDTQTQTQTHWAVNEKIAFEMALGAALGGVRAAVTMKHVGLNVAADPLMTSAYSGVNGGFVIFSADDPNMYSSQNEQDNRHYALFAKIPMLEPSDSQEAFHFTQIAFEISEKFNTPVILRTTMRVAHSYSLVTLDPPTSPLLPKSFETPHQETGDRFNKNDPRTIMLPSIGRIRHRLVEERLLLLKDFSNNLPANQFFPGEGDTLLVTAGGPYHIIREMFDRPPIYKAALTHPLPTEKIKEVAKDYREVIVVEELDPIIERELLVSGLPYEKLRKRNPSFYLGELSPERCVTLITHNDEGDKSLGHVQAPPPAPINPPRLCSGCPHLTISNLLRELDLTVSGDIGCYTLAALEPFKSLHTVIDMGASIPMMLGMQLAKKTRQSQSPPTYPTHPSEQPKDPDTTATPPALNRPNASHSELPPFLAAMREENEARIAVIGDSTFLHSGMPGLLEAGVLSPDAVLCLLDNGTTAMTGQQLHAGSAGLTSPLTPIPQNKDTEDESAPQSTPPAPRVNYFELARSFGIRQTHICDPYDLPGSRKILERALAEKGFSLVIFERACALLKPAPLPVKAVAQPATSTKENITPTKENAIPPNKPLPQAQPKFKTADVGRTPHVKLPSGTAEVHSNCVKCGACLQVGCPSIRFDVTRGRPRIDQASCIGCGICLDACAYDALRDAAPVALSDLLALSTN